MAKKNPSRARAASAPTKQEPFLVEKADGSIGQWGNALNFPVPKQEYRMYPEGMVSQQDVDYLRTLNDPKLNGMLDAPGMAIPGQVPQFAQDQSDVIKGLLALRGKAPIAPAPPPIDPLALPLASAAPPVTRVRAVRK